MLYFNRLTAVKKLILISLSIVLLICFLSPPSFAADDFPRLIRIDTYQNGKLVYVGITQAKLPTSAEAEAAMLAACSAPCWNRGRVNQNDIGWGCWICRRDITDNGVHYQIDRCYRFPLDGIMPENPQGAAMGRGN